MAQSFWPRYASSSAGNPRLLAGFLLDLQTVKATLVVLTSIAAYLAGISLPIPTVRPSAMASTGSWWFLALFDQLFTGGAFGRGAFFCLGLFSILMLGRIPARVAPGTKRPLLIPLLKFCLLTALAVAVFLMRGSVPLEAREIAITFLAIALGGVCITWINRK